MTQDEKREIETREKFKPVCECDDWHCFESLNMTWTEYWDKYDIDNFPIIAPTCKTKR